MNKILKYSLISILAIVIALVLYILVSPRSYHPDCYAGGGKWKGFPDSCVDRCGCEIFHDTATEGCDCGPDKCWNGKECMPNKKYCEKDSDCAKQSTCCSAEAVNKKYIQDIECKLDILCVPSPWASKKAIVKCIDNWCRLVYKNKTKNEIYP